MGPFPVNASIRRWAPSVGQTTNFREQYHHRRFAPRTDHLNPGTLITIRSEFRSPSSESATESKQSPPLRRGESQVETFANQKNDQLSETKFNGSANQRSIRLKKRDVSSRKGRRRRLVDCGQWPQPPCDKTRWPCPSRRLSRKSGPAGTG